MKLRRLDPIPAMQIILFVQDSILDKVAHR